MRHRGTKGRTAPDCQCRGGNNAFACTKVAAEVAVDIGHRFALAEAAEAHRLIESRGSVGKIVLVP